MSNAMKAADDLKSIAKRFQGIMEVAQILEKIGSLEQAERDAVARKEAAYAEEKKAQLLILDLDGKIAVKQEAIKIAESQADHIVVKAKEKAQQVYNELAEKNAASLKQANEIKVLAEAAVSAKRVEVEELNKLISAKKLELEDVSSQIAAVKSKLSALFK